MNIVHRQHTRKLKTICIVGPYEAPGGVSQSVRYLYFIYRKLGFNVRIVPPVKTIKPSLHSCDIIHTQGPLPFLKLMEMLFHRRSGKILTLRGWVLEEAKVFLINPDISILRRVIVFACILINWIVHMLLIIPFVYDIVTAVSDITARKNRVKALIIKNPIMPSNIEKKLIYCNSVEYKNKNDIIFVTYVSIGGSKITSIPRLIKLVNMLNKYLGKNNENKRIKLLIFGKDLPEYFVSTTFKEPYVMYMGYSPHFLCYVKDADLFIAGYSFPELGHAVIEAGLLGIPVAKYTDNPEEEEIIDGVTGILAKDDEEMFKKLLFFINNLEYMKKLLGQNLREYILKTRNIDFIAIRWKIIMKYVLSRHL